MRSEISKELDTLSNEDIYSVMLYGIYKLTGDPHYSTISELIYALDKDNLLKLCSVFGGCTIRIPRINELKVFIDALLLYQYVNNEKLPVKESLKKITDDTMQIKEILEAYNTISEVIDEFIQIKDN